MKNITCIDCGKVTEDVDYIDGLEVQCEHCGAKFYWELDPEDGELHLVRD